MSSLHVSGDLAPAGRFSVVVLPVGEITPSVSVGGVALAPTSGATTFTVPPGAAVGATIAIVAGGVSRSFLVADPGPTTWVIPLATQSNMIQADASDSNAWPSEVKFAAQNSRLFTPSELVTYWSTSTGRFSLPKGFAVDFLSAHPLDQIIFAPCAIGGTGFSDNEWNPGDPRYVHLIERTNAVLAANPSARLRCVLVQGFEQDSGDATPPLTFRAQLAAFIAGIRSDLRAGSPALPFVLGEMPAERGAVTSAAIAIRDEMLTTPERIAHTSVASSRTPTSFGTLDGTHFDLAGATGMGYRHYAALAAADANTLA